LNNFIAETLKYKPQLYLDFLKNLIYILGVVLKKLLKNIGVSMKKFLSTAMVLGALYGTANAAPVTSPIYMPEAGKILSNINLGYTMRNSDEDITEDGDEMYSAVNLGLEGKIGVMDRLAINYGFNFDFARKILDEDSSAKFTNYYIGVTGRVADAGANKLDLILNVGQGNDAFISLSTMAYVDFGVRYGLELDRYNLGFSVRGKYVNDEEVLGETVLDGGFDVAFALENEFIFTDNFTAGLDLNYSINDDYGDSDSYNIFGFNVDLNYGLNQNNFIGVYYAMDFNDADEIEPTTYKFGLKFTSQF